MTTLLRRTTDRHQAVHGLYALGHKLLERERSRDAADVFRAMIMVAPRDERGWLGLGACHEAIGQERLAAELYASARIVAQPAGRCEIALARALRRIDGDPDIVEGALDRAEQVAERTDDEALRALVAWERRQS